MDRTLLATIQRLPIFVVFDIVNADNYVLYDTNTLPKVFLFRSW